MIYYGLIMDIIFWSTAIILGYYLITVFSMPKEAKKE